MPLFICPKFAECQYREFSTVSISPKGIQDLCPTHKIPLVEEDMKASGFIVSSGGIKISEGGEMEFNTAKLSVTGDVRNKGKMSFEDTDVKIDGNLENEGIFSMNEKKIILKIIETMKNGNPNTDDVNKSFAELYNETNGKGRWESAIRYIKKNVTWEFRVGLVSGIPHVEFKIGSR